MMSSTRTTAMPRLSRFAFTLLLAACCSVFLAAAALAEPSRGLLWEVRGENCTVWLLGSVHVADKSLYPLSETIENAYATSEVLGVEVDVTAPLAPDAQAILESAVYPAGKSLEDDLSPDIRRQFADHGLDLSPFMHMRPWFAFMAAAQVRMAELGLDPSLGVDLHFLTRAHKQGKQIVELESAARQLADMRDMAEDDFPDFVHYMLQDLDRLEEDLDVFLGAWKTGDAELMEQRLFLDLKHDPGLKPFFERMFFVRNVGMAEKIEGYLASGKNHFVIVGAGHLVGERSVVDLLTRAGYEVTRR